MALFVDEQVIEERENKQFIQMINEAYFGRTPGITRCFNAFCDFRNKYLRSNKVGQTIVSITNLTADHDKDLHRFCNEMERQFGFDSFFLVIENSATVNAYTYPIMFGAGDKDPKKNLIIDKEGYHFKKELKMSGIVCIYTSLLFNIDFSNEEMFAIILHEVGHNFQSYINGSVRSLDVVYKILYIYETILYTLINLGQGDIEYAISKISELFMISKPTHSVFFKAYNKLTSNENMINLYSYFNFVKGLISVPTALIQGILMVPLIPIQGIMIGISAVMQSLMILPIHANKYLGEQIADAFPTYYGFGVANINTFKEGKLSPFGPFVKTVSNLPLIGHIYNLFLIPTEILLSIGDEHPSDIVRCQSMIDAMKTDLNDKRLSPKLRKELSKQITEIEKGMDDYYEKACTIKNPHVFKNFINRAIFNKGGDFKYKAFKSIFNPHADNLANANMVRGESAVINVNIV